MITNARIVLRFVLKNIDDTRVPLLIKLVVYPIAAKKQQL